MSELVKLYVYDLSNGLAKQMSLQLTGRQIDGIWHTSIVAFGKETFYGQGINQTPPGRSHHGQPLQIIDLGETAIDEETFNEYIEDMREMYTAEKYHLLGKTLNLKLPLLNYAKDFNCNSFTNDVAGFLTGDSIPAYIRDLPTDFLSTPFGAALRPTIDSMYRRPSPGITPAPTPPPVASILQDVAARAQAPSYAPSSQGLPATQSLTGPIHLCTNMSSFRNLISSHRSVVVCFSNIVTCPPCRMIAPVFEQLAHEKGIKSGNNKGAVFVKIDMSISAGNSLAGELGVRVMPTFMFYLDGRKTEQMQGADPTELRTQIDLLLFQAFPPHHHTSISIPSIETMSLDPILFTQVPPLDTVSSKLVASIESTSWPPKLQQSATQAKEAILKTVIPHLKSRFPAKATGSVNGTTSPTSPAILSIWAQTTQTLLQALPLEAIFPVVDLWRLGILDPAVGAWLVSNPSQNPLEGFLAKIPTSSLQDVPRNYLLTILRFICNGFKCTTFANNLFSSSKRELITPVLIQALLYKDAAVRTSAASLLFNFASVLQKVRIEKVKNNTPVTIEDEDWEVEVVSAVIEALSREEESEEIVHRLTASLGLLVRLSPYYETQLLPLLEVLQARSILQSKSKDRCVNKKEVKKLLEDVSKKLCP